MNPSLAVPDAGPIAGPIAGLLSGAQPPPGSNTRRWQWLLLALCLCCGGLRLWALIYIDRSIVPEAAGGLGAKLKGPFSGLSWQLTVVRVEPGSDLERQGVQPGDRVSYDIPGDFWRYKGIGDTCTYYNEAVHKGAFLLPEYIAKVYK